MKQYGFYILKRLNENQAHYVPTVDIYSIGYEHPIVNISLVLPVLPSETQFDHLRIVLKKWAAECDFGELAEAIQ